MGVKVQGTDIILDGMVGGEPDSFWFGDGFSATHVIDALAQIGTEQDITVHLNSGGGIATEGSAIHAALAQHKGKVKVIVEGIAASAASLLAMAGDTITMAAGAIMMIHDPASVTVGDAKAHRKSAEMLEAHGNAYAGVYASRASISLVKARAIMIEETWYTGAEAVAAGFADSSSLDDDSETQPAAFAYAAYRNAPTALVAMANAHGWKARAHLAAPVASHKEPIMTKKKDKDVTDAGETALVEAANEAPAVVEAAADLVADANRRAATISSICNQADHPAWAAGFIEGTLTVEEVQAKLDISVGINAAVAQARKIAPAIGADIGKEFYAAGKTVVEAKAALLEEILKHQSDELSPQVPAVKGPVIDRKQTSDGWDKVIAKLPAQQG